MQLIRKHSSTSNILRARLRNSSTGQGLTGLTEASSGLIISTITDNEATVTRYRAGSSEIETISSLGTFAAPTSGKCRFKEVDSTNEPGLYELQFADARYAVASAKTLRIFLSGATNLLGKEILVQLSTADLDTDAMGALKPNTAGRTLVVDAAGLADANTVKVGPSGSGTAQTARDLGTSVLLSSGTGAGQVSITSGVVQAALADGVSHGGTLGSSTATLALSRLSVVSQFSNTNAVTATGNGTGHGMALTSGSGATGNGLTLLAASTNGHGLKSTGTGTGDGAELTAGASGADLDADIAGVLATVTTAVNVTTVNGLAAGVITATSIASDAFTAANFAADVATEFQAGLATAAELAKVPKSDGTATWNSTALGSINAECDTALADAKAGYAAAIEAAILNEGDATALLAAIAAKVEEFLLNEGDASATLAAIAAAVRANLATELGRIDAAITTRQPTIWSSASATVSLSGTTMANLTNAPSAGDFTATMKTSIGTAVAASAVASVIGNVGGNVTGSVGSLATQAKADVNAEVDTAIADVGLTTTVIGRIDAAVTTRMATYVQPTGFLAATFPSDPADQSLVIAATDALMTAINALNNLSSAQAQTAAAAALTAYDPPTNAEMEARTLAAASYATAANQATIIAKTNLIPASPAAVGSEMTLVDGAITETKISTPAESAGRPTGLLGMMRRVFERMAGGNKQSRDRDTGTVTLRNSGDTANLEVHTQSTVGNVDSLSKGA